MRSDIPAAMQAAFDSGQFKVANMVAIHFDNPIYLTDHHHALNVNSNVYQPIKGDSTFPKITESMENKKGTVTLQLPNTDRIWDSIIVTNGFVDKWVNIGKAVFDKDEVLTGILDLWGGVTTKPITDETKITISAASHHTIFQKTNSVKTNDVSYQRYLPADIKVEDRTMWWAGTAKQFVVGS